MVKGFEELRQLAIDLSERYTFDEILGYFTRFDPVKVELKNIVDFDYYTGLDRRKYRKRLSFYSDRFYDVGKGKYMDVKKQVYRQDLKHYALINFLCNYPFNLDSYNGYCSFGCVYCYAINYSQLVLRNLFDQTPEYTLKVVKEKDLIDALHGRFSSYAVAFSLMNYLYRMRVPFKYGIRSDSFMPLDLTYKRTVRLLEELENVDVRVIINTKSTLFWRHPVYRKRLEKVMDKVYVIMSITAPRRMSDWVKNFMEPGSPTISERFDVLREYAEVGGKIGVWFSPPLMFKRSERIDDVVNDFLDDVLDAYPDEYRYKLAGIYRWHVESITIRQYTKMAISGFDGRIFPLIKYSSFWHGLLTWMFWGRARKRGLLSAFNEMFLRLDGDKPFCEGVEHYYYDTGDFRVNPISVNMFFKYLYEHPLKRIGFLEWVRNVVGYKGNIDKNVLRAVALNLNVEGVSMGIRRSSDNRFFYDNRIDFEDIEGYTGGFVRFLKLFQGEKVEPEVSFVEGLGKL